jgi:hypothetical protein
MPELRLITFHSDLADATIKAKLHTVLIEVSVSMGRRPAMTLLLWALAQITIAEARTIHGQAHGSQQRWGRQLQVVINWFSLCTVKNGCTAAADAPQVSICHSVVGAGARPLLQKQAGQVKLTDHVWTALR